MTMFLELKARYATALNRAVTRDSRTTFVVWALRVNVKQGVAQGCN